MNFIDEKIDDYSVEHTSSETPLLEKIHRETHLEVLRPRMLSGPFQGRLLSMFSKMLRPHRILEIGTYTGYSALCLAEGLSEKGVLYTLDINAELEDRVRAYFKESEYHHKIDFRIGDANELIPKINEPWDLVFIDADKTNYLNYYEMLISSVKSGGYVIADNVLWSGKVVDHKMDDTDTVALRAFNDFLSTDPRVEVVLLPVRDGLMLARKK